MANIGKIVQVIGPVLDVKFDAEKSLPNLLNALVIKHGDEEIVAEVAQHVGDDTVRCIAMSSTDGLVRGMDVVDTGAPISVPGRTSPSGRPTPIGRGWPSRLRSNPPRVCWCEVWPIPTIPSTMLR